MRYLEDLRLIIGLLFAILGILVLVAAPGAQPAVGGGGVNADVVGGVVMTAFAALMILLAFLAPPKDR